jgi:hypothetical protein
MSHDFGYSYQTRKNGDVAILRHGEIVTLLKKNRAQDFLDNVEKRPNDAQMLMAKITGNYKRGNERVAQFDQKFDGGEDITDMLDLSKARRPTK